MRVLHVIPAVAPRYGGPSQAIFGMCRALRARGVETLVATTDADGGSCLEVELGTPVVYHDLPTIFFHRQWSEALKVSRPMALWLDGNVSSFDVLHIHAVFSHSCLAGARACRRHSVPYVVRPLGSLDPWSLKQKRARKQLCWYLGARAMMHNAAAVHYTAAEERRLVEESLGLSRGVVIPLGVDEAMLERSNKPKASPSRRLGVGTDPYVLTLCRIHPKKRLDLLLDVFLDLGEQKPFLNWRLVVAGEGDDTYMAMLRSRLQGRSAAERVLFPGWLTGPDKVEALRGAALVVLPSYQENFALSIVEAMGCGVPVLVSDRVNLAAEIQGAGAGWVTPLNRERFAKVLSEALADEVQRERRGNAGRRLVLERFRWSNSAPELEKLYLSLLRR